MTAAYKCTLKASIIQHHRNLGLRHNLKKLKIIKMFVSTLRTLNSFLWQITSQIQCCIEVNTRASLIFWYTRYKQTLFYRMIQTNYIIRSAIYSPTTRFLASLCVYSVCHQHLTDHIPVTCLTI